MTTQEKLVNRKLSIIELAEFLKNVSQACRINGVSRQHFYDIKKAYDEHGIEGLKEKSRRKPCIKNRVAPEGHAFPGRPHRQEARALVGSLHRRRVPPLTAHLRGAGQQPRR